MLQIPHEFLAVLQGSEYAFDYAISTNKHPWFLFNFEGVTSRGATTENHPNTAPAPSQLNMKKR